MSKDIVDSDFPVGPGLDLLVHREVFKRDLSTVMPFSYDIEWAMYTLCHVRKQYGKKGKLLKANISCTKDGQYVVHIGYACAAGDTMAGAICRAAINLVRMMDFIKEAKR